MFVVDKKYKSIILDESDVRKLVLKFHPTIYDTNSKTLDPDQTCLYDCIKKLNNHDSN